MENLIKPGDRVRFLVEQDEGMECDGNSIEWRRGDEATVAEVYGSFISTTDYKGGLGACIYAAAVTVIS
jgi:hypothetical protein